MAWQLNAYYILFTPKHISHRGAKSSVTLAAAAFSAATDTTLTSNVRYTIR